MLHRHIATVFIILITFCIIQLLIFEIYSLINCTFLINPEKVQSSEKKITAKPKNLIFNPGSLPRSIDDPFLSKPIVIGTIQNDTGKSKRILMWTKYFSDRPELVLNNWLSPEKIPGRKWYKECSKTCIVTFDKQELNQSDAVLFHSINVDRHKTPRRYHQNQIWVYLQEEAPTFQRWDFQDRQHEFNWTMSYRRDADVFHPYGYVKFIPFELQNETRYSEMRLNLQKELQTSKKIIAAWTSSNCFAWSRRQDLVMLLKRYFTVDVFGGCSNHGRDTKWPDGWLGLIEKKYKFYLAFENSLCLDYVTEKFFRTLQHNIVPVVYGFVNYTSIAPPHSFINVMDFPSIKSMVNYLLYLDKHDEEYLKYFEWKRNYAIIPGGVAWCTLCHKLWNRDVNIFKWYSNIWKWEKFVGQAKTVHTVFSNGSGLNRQIHSSRIKNTKLVPTCVDPTIEFDKLRALIQ